jgi:tetraacyldisaccharide 4'-kinase
MSKKIDFKIPIISIGNLTIGGNGKTPFLISLAKNYESVAIILRGYGRNSKGLHVVTKETPVDISGDEAKLYTNALSNAIVIVSEDRSKAILKAIKMGCKIIFLDDGFSKSFIKKFDVLIRPKIEPKLPFCLPSGAYREPKFLYNSANLVVRESDDFKRVVTIKNETKNMILVTAISKPQRLDEYLPKVKAKIYFEDHYMYKKEELLELIQKYKASSILTTSKDEVKMRDFNLPLSILDLHVDINPNIKNKINEYLYNFR